MAALVLMWRLIRRESVQPAVSGFFGVAVCALIAYVVGQSKGYFLLGIWTSLVWAVVFALSVLIRRPMVGYLWSWATGRDRGWREVPRAVYAFDVATLGWTLVFAARFVVQRLLYDADQTGWLGVARIAMGWPLTALAALATYAAIKAVRRALPAPDSVEEKTPDAAATAAAGARDRRRQPGLVVWAVATRFARFVLTLRPRRKSASARAVSAESMSCHSVLSKRPKRATTSPKFRLLLPEDCVADLGNR